VAQAKIKHANKINKLKREKRNLLIFMDKSTNGLVPIKAQARFCLGFSAFETVLFYDGFPQTATAFF